MKRNNWIDISKGIGILLVVYGHVMQGMNHRGLIDWKDFHVFSNAFVYSFHMPLFFLIGGFWISFEKNKAFLSFLKIKISKIYYPYLLWSFFSILLRPLFVHYQMDTSLPSLVDAIKALLNGSLSWFLPTFFCVNITSFFICQTGLPLQILISLGSIFVFSKLPSSELGGYSVVLKSFFYFLPFSVFGSILSKVIFDLDRISRKCLMFIFISSISTTLTFTYLNLHEYIIVKLLMGLIGSLAVFSFSCFIKKYNFSKFLENAGFCSLSIFLLHPYFQGFSRLIILKYFGFISWYLSVIIQVIFAVLLSIITFKSLKKLGLECFFSLKS